MDAAGWQNASPVGFSCGTTVLGGETLVVTHEFLSILLGVRRAGVTVALHLLESKLLIKVSRTLIRVLDCDGLRAAANGFYGIPEAEYDRLIGPLARPD